MKQPFEQIIDKIESFVVLEERIKTKEKLIYVSPFSGSSKSLIIKKIAHSENQILLMLPSVQAVNEVKVELSILGLEKSVVAADDLSPEMLQEKLTDLNSRKNFVLLSTYELLKLKLPSKQNIEANTTNIEIGGNLSYDDLIEYFNAINYNRDKYVEQPGDFAVRGSIIDFWSYSEKQPCRLEFDGDFIESIRHFDAETQRSADKLERVTLAASLAPAEENLGDIFDYLNNPLIFADEYELQNLFIAKTVSSEEKLPDDIDDELKEELYDADETTDQVQEQDHDQVKNEKLSIDELFEKNARWVIEDALGKDERVQLHLYDAPIINSNYELLSNILLDFTNKQYQTIIAVENELQSKRLYDLLCEFRNELMGIFDSGAVKLQIFPIKSGFVDKQSKLFVLTDYQIFNKPYRTKLSTKAKYRKSRVKDFASIKRGDFVVHESFGIGQYAGLEKIKIGDIEQESIKILYAEGGVVYVNLNYLSLVKKFSSQDNVQPKLSVLGGSEWKTTKKKVKAKIKEAARELITLYAKRKAAKGFSFSSDSIWQRELEASFMYEDTPDQTKVTEEVKGDMEGENPMDRLVCGDVGFGKTEIAVRAAFKAMNDGKQVALLAPTTILTEQHFNTFKNRLSQFPVRVEALSRFQSAVKQKEIVEKVSKGEVDIVVGTHRLLSKDIKFKDLGLLIIDEEHRFGVMAKEKLRSYKTNVDTLTLTATPIPRTLNLSLLGARDLSIMATPPPNRQPIYTKVAMFEIPKVREWVLNEIRRNGQVYFVHDRIQSIEKIAAYVKKYVPEINIGIAHGRMKPAELEKVIYGFLNKHYHMLISTKIIESGLDIPNVNTIIINRADRFGLAELHQLRGRVGRSDRQAYAYFLVPSLNAITKKAVKRLQAIEEYTDLGEGFNLAMRDLEIRGAGNLLGTEQSGNIDSVGFDLYMKMVDEAVEELKQDEFKEIFQDLPRQQERSEPTIDAFFELGIPHSYMPDQSDRLSFYTTLFTLVKIEELDEIRDEMRDKFGRPPLTVERLIQTAVLRFYASFALLERIIIQKQKIIIILPKGDRENFYKIQFIPLLTHINSKYSKEIKFVQSNETLKLEIGNKFETAEKVLEFLISFVQEITNVISGVGSTK
ncbi:MAG: transcription-repair coupling factor [Stygiobacter sp. RIFOXYC12_FULL_38_8]|nr:MAG: transcription-repair coupling factor [Stygiobacter sp. RIFOXYA2_FULL_38_8]OGV14452.1 MAG: transcription-repair coupling factor [Stygiobacter sp. RIFOXYC2_FULL_38_25]OGV29889.1 MAG: transcription-repair coupling factor [Stygiobacter sp. RIFOXYC12_FULL_38_8]OGV82212.1 MAG: transcription-repair coupling factor [Stygiobacter sp. GWF2_38_21]RJQ57564.1 MAG: transcription-repair coupling factor [Stygiobacter sp.]